ncbi:hypothetical protein AJ80_05945 [Polytolypa hystricis UAMH7299]|uniref:Uncharacterized protein n=1 Tax=Polytolypa hystricis (strain UAMH7299) TaxID=1447883 RepID=A0A2B7XZJ4_POLH7|nr:hypothetical protein AJ80_05945 [Polytolypa hystricis UAMH7299]
MLAADHRDQTSKPESQKATTRQRDNASSQVEDDIEDTFSDTFRGRKRRRSSSFDSFCRGEEFTEPDLSESDTDLDCVELKQREFVSGQGNSAGSMRDDGVRMRAKGMTFSWPLTGVCGAFNTYVNSLGIDAFA